MRDAKWLLGLAVLAAGCADSTKCGEDTIEMNGLCVPALQCGAGTVLSAEGCVVATGDGPQVTSITPALDLIGGGAEFTIEGSGFRAEGAGDTEVVFGDVAAVFEIVSDTQIRGRVPRGTGPRVELRVANQNGETTVPFRYVGVLAADGNEAIAGSLWLVDPRDGVSVEIGPIVDADGIGYPVTGLAFAPDGALYATEPSSPSSGAPKLRGKGGPARPAHLLRIDPETARATVIGELIDAVDDSVTHVSIADITFNGTTLVGWTELGDDPVSIDTLTGLVTVLGPGTTSGGSGMATLANGSTIVAPEGTGGSLHTVNLQDGTTTVLVALDDGAAESSFEICALTSAGPVLLGLLCNEDHGSLTESLLATIDVTTGAVTVRGAGPSAADAIAAPGDLVIPAATTPVSLAAPRGALAATIERASTCARRAGTIELSGRRAGRVTVAELATSTRSVPVASKRAGVRGLALDAIVAEDVTVMSCGGAEARFTRKELAGYALVANQRGRIKLVDRASGRPVLKNVVGLRVE